MLPKVCQFSQVYAEWIQDTLCYVLNFYNMTILSFIIVREYMQILTKHSKIFANPTMQKAVEID